MSDMSLGAPIAGLVLCILLSAFFSGTETALMSINRHRLRHLAGRGHAGARLTERLLARPDRLIGVILLGNTLATLAAGSIVTLMTLRLADAHWLAAANGALTIVLLLFSELGPKTYGALHAERLALPAAFVYRPLLWATYPIVWLINSITNAILRLAGVSAERVAAHSLSADELRTVVAEAGALIPLKHQQMLVSILDLERIRVDDIMVPRSEVAGIDLNDDWERILGVLRDVQHTRIPVYEGDIDHIIGVLHMKRVTRALARGALDREQLIELARQREPYYVPEGTTLNQQLVAFQQAHRRHAYVVDEYGDVQGLVTIEDILEEIVGEFTSLPYALRRDVKADDDGSYVVAGSTTVRALNRSLGWHLPTGGPKTLNGLILEYLETIPEPGTSLKLAGHPLEVLQIADNAVKTVRIWPAQPAEA
ncbi:MAG TPA: HlyC/CorC family transporter [Steroidobacteraceae bacterium]|nr:HlyC/CorC family transporter [Steroidobacteraceae bacterium]